MGRGRVTAAGEGRVWEVLSGCGQDEDGFPAVAAGNLTPEFLGELSELAETVAGVHNWSRLGLWAEAATRLLVVLRSRRGRSAADPWPPRLRPSETPDLLLDLAEVLGRRSGHLVHIGTPFAAQRSGPEWHNWVLPMLAAGAVPEEARFDDELRHDLISALDRMNDDWIDGPVTEPDEAFWDLVESGGVDQFVLDGGAVLLGNPSRPSEYDAMFRHVVNQLLEAGIGTGIGVLRVAQAARTALGGRGAILAVEIQPGAYEVPLTGARRWARRLVDSAAR